MNVCMIAYTFYDGDNRVMRYAETLAARGDHVDVIALRQPNDLETRQTVNGVNVYKVQARAYNERGLRSYVFRLSTFFLRAMWLVSKRHRKIKYDVIHVHSVPDALVFTAVYPKLTGAKVILDIHDLLPELFTNKFAGGSHKLLHRALVLVEAASAAFADHVIIANDLWRDKIVNRGSVVNQKCTAILNFPDPTIFKPNGVAPHGPKTMIMYPGTLNWHQGLDVAIRAFASISPQVPNAEFHIYGDGSAKPALIELAKELGMAEKIIFHKCQPLRSIAKLMATADLAVVPKRKDSFGNEAFSTKTLEFMSVGVPLVLADTKIDQYYFNDSVVRFFKSGDEKDLAEAMLSLIQNKNERERLASNALQFVQQHSWGNHQQGYLNLVDTLAQA